MTKSIVDNNQSVNMFLTVLFLLGLLPSISLAATIEVTAQIGESGCDLIEAIQSANADTSVGGCTAGNDADEILISGTHILTQPFDNPGAPNDEGDAGLPDISTEISIVGVSDHTEIKREVSDPLNRFRIFNIVSPIAHLELDNIIVSGGDVNFPPLGSDSDQRGGGIYVARGDLTLVDSSIINNIGGIFAGGVHSHSSGKITITRSRIANNTANFHAALFSWNADELLITDSTIEGNHSRTGIGDIIGIGYSDSMRIMRSAIINNDGSGLNVSTGRLTILDSTVSGNGHELFINPSETTGAISMYPGENSTLIILNSTITNNPAPDFVVTPFLSFSGIKLLPPNSTTTHSFSVILRNNIISGNGAAGMYKPQTGYEINAYEYDANVSADDIDFELSNNIIGHAGISEYTAINNINIDPLTNKILTADSNSPTALSDILNPLNHYGGLTKSHTLPENSPAKDYGTPGYVSAIGIGSLTQWNPGCRGHNITINGFALPYRTDQRGLSRPIDGACDAGSTEFRPSDILSDCYVIKASNNNVITFCL